MKFYLAAPFFKQEQQDVLEQVEKHAEALGLECFSPRWKCLCPPDATVEQRDNSFRMNCNGISESEFVLARIDDFDPGTIWEIGYAFATKVPVYAFTTVQNRGLNLMLSQSCVGFLREIPSVFKFLEEARNGNFREAQLWKESII